MCTFRAFKNNLLCSSLHSSNQNWKRTFNNFASQERVLSANRNSGLKIISLEPIFDKCSEKKRRKTVKKPEVIRLTLFLQQAEATTLALEEMTNSVNYIATVLKEDPDKVFSAALAHMKLVTANLCIIGENFSGRGTDHLMRLAMEVASVMTRLQPQVEH